MKNPYYLLACLFLTLTTCKGKSASDILQILCGRGEHKSQMTVGLNLDTIKDYFSLDRADDSPIPDSDVQEYLNSSLAKFGVSESTFNIQNVESVKEGDTVRFLQLGGVIGEAFGASASFLKNTFSGSGDRSESNPFDFINESFGVRAAAAQENYRKARVQEFFETYLPFLVDNVSRGHTKQWAYEQTDLQASATLFEQMIIAAQAKFPSQVNINSNPIVVAVLDTGVDVEHNKGLGNEDLNLDAFYRDNEGNIIGYNATSEGGPGEFDDENGHGTHCAGIIASRKADPDDEAPLGVASMANTKIMPIKVLTKDGAGGFQAIEKGVRWAMHNG
ncbi:MAG: S8 family serine peptidase, partial [Oligoflexales bacterium]|nr:S8 family serine peptidase [Oligoflexales bacterium]